MLRICAVVAITIVLLNSAFAQGPCGKPFIGKDEVRLHSDSDSDGGRSFAIEFTGWGYPVSAYPKKVTVYDPNTQKSHTYDVEGYPNLVAFLVELCGSDWMATY